MDSAIAIVIAAVGVADVLVNSLFEPRWLAVIVTLVAFLPLGVRRRFPLAVLTTVGAASLVLEWLLGNPKNSTQFGLEVLVAWLIVAYSAGAYTKGRRHLAAVGIRVLIAVAWIAGSLALGASNENTVPAVLLCAVAWIIGRAVQRRDVQVEVLDDRARQLEREREEKVRALVAEERTRISSRAARRRGPQRERDGRAGTGWAPSRE